MRAPPTEDRMARHQELKEDGARVGVDVLAHLEAAALEEETLYPQLR